MKTKFTLLGVIASFMVGCAAPPPPPPRPVTPDQWAALAIVQDDPLSPSLRITSGGPQDSWVNSDIYRQRKHLVASIDRRTGKTTVTVQMAVTYRASEWAFFNRATYIGPDGIAVTAKNFHRGRGHVESCSGGRCTYDEVAAFQIEPEELQLLALAKRAGKIRQAYWNVRFAGSGWDIDLDFEFAEIEGFIQALRKAQKA